MRVERVPIRGDAPRHRPEQMRGQVRDPHPGQDQEAGVVAQQMHPRPAHRGRPADEAFARAQLAGGRCEAQAGERAALAEGQVLDLLTDPVGGAQVVVLGDQPRKSS